MTNKISNFAGYDFHNSSAISKIEVSANRFDFEFVVFYTSNPEKGYHYSANFTAHDKFMSFLELYDEFDLSLGKFIHQLIKLGYLVKV